MLEECPGLEVKIADLGVSDEFDGPDALLTNTAGTPAFTPPECLQASGSQSAPFSGRAADIWSLGVTLFCLVTGFLPFHGDNVMEVYNKITNTEPQVRLRDDYKTDLHISLTRYRRVSPPS